MSQKAIRSTSPSKKTGETEPIRKKEVQKSKHLHDTNRGCGTGKVVFQWETWDRPLDRVYPMEETPGKNQ